MKAAKLKGKTENGEKIMADGVACNVEESGNENEKMKI